MNTSNNCGNESEKKGFFNYYQMSVKSAEHLSSSFNRLIELKIKNGWKTNFKLIHDCIQVDCATEERNVIVENLLNVCRPPQLGIKIVNYITKKPNEKNNELISQTDHGRGIAEQVQGEDCYGYSNTLNEADIYHILGNIHTHFCAVCDGSNHQPKMRLLEKWMLELLDNYNIRIT